MPLWRGLDSEHRAVLHVGGEIEVAVRALLDVTDPLTEGGEQRFSAALQVVGVELEARNLPSDEKRDTLIFSELSIAYLISPRRQAYIS